MNSPLYSLQSDMSTPKPYFYKASEDISNVEFSGYLDSLQTDITALGKEVENLRNENHILKATVELIEREKEKHIIQHAKEKFDLEKALKKERKTKNDVYSELTDLRAQYQSLLQKTTSEKNSSGYFRDSFSEKNLKNKKTINVTLKTKLSKMEKEHNLLKKKVRDIETGTFLGMNKSLISRWNEEQE